jgi:PKHD-type hydroxylase
MKYDYYTYDLAVPVEACQEIKNNLEHDLDTGITDLSAPVVKTAQVNVVPWAKAKRYLMNLEQLVMYTNKRFFGFDLYSMTDYDTVNYNQYNGTRGGEYAWHKDSARHDDAGDIKLTAILNLSNQRYQGGEFELFLNGSTLIDPIKNTGSVIVFPSYIQHRVRPVTNGDRTTVSLWFSGPKFK